MKNSLLRILFCLIAVTIGLAPLTNSQAQIYTTCPGTDQFAIFFENGDINFDAQANVPVNVYYAIIGPSVECVSGFEFRLGAPADPLYFVLSEVFNGNAINVGISPDYVVGFSAPLPSVNNQTLVMTQQVLLLDLKPRQFFIEPTSVPSVPGRIVYVDCNDFNNLVTMNPVSGDFALPVAQLNGTPLSYCNQPAPLDLAVYIGFDGDNDNIAGTSEGATDGFDAEYDQSDQDLSLTFPHPEWAANAGNYRHDIKAAFDPTREVRQWTFVANAQVPQSDARYVSLTFQPNFPADPDMDFQLLDRTTGATTDLFQQNTFQYYLSDGETFNRTFDLFIGREVIPEPNLWVDVTASNHSFSEATNRLSTDPAATDGYDPGLDIPEPTPPPSNFVSSSFIHADWPLGPRFRTDTRALFDPTLETRTWPLRVETDQSGQILLNFAAGFTDDDGIGLKLYDRQSGQSFNLFPQMNYVFEANGISTYWFDISVGASGPPIPAPTSRYIGAGWALVGLPLMPMSRTLGEVALDQIPGYGFMFEHQPGQGYNLLEASTIARQDQGYWLATDSAFSWTMTGQPNLAGQMVPLTPGWNLVGNPMWFPGPFEGMAVVHNGTSIPWLQAVASGLVATGVQSYNQNTGGYFDAVDLQPWHGYWINALVPNLQLVFHWESFQNLPVRLTANKSDLPVDERVWSADLTLWDSKRLQTTITMGFNPEATEGFDSRFDMPMAPTPPNGGPIMAFTRPEWGLASGAYFSRDVMPISDREVLWNAVISVENPGTANLIWDSSDWPKNADFQIYLPTENRVVVMSMRAQSSVQFEIGDEPLPIVIRTPSMATGVDDIPGLAYKVSVYPNPFNPMTTVNFDLPRSGEVEIRLYNVRGELVNVLADEHYVAGSHKVVWQGTDRSGRNVPSGSYFAKLFVDGQAMGSVTKMSLVR